MSNFNIVQCVPGDEAELARLHYSIFSQPPVYHVIYAGVPEEKIIEKYEKGFKEGIEGQSQPSSTREATYLKVTDHITNQIAGYVVWVYLPKGYDADQDPQIQASDMPVGSNLPVALELKRAARSSRTYHEDRKGPHYLVALLGTNPNFERRGVASMLIRYMFDNADRKSISCFVEASSKAQPLYKRHGFVDVNLMHVDLDDFEGGDGFGLQTWYAMLREPQPMKYGS